MKLTTVDVSEMFVIQKLKDIPHNTMFSRPLPFINVKQEINKPCTKITYTLHVFISMYEVLKSLKIVLL